MIHAGEEILVRLGVLHLVEQELHRIDEQFAIADFRKHGLVWEAAIPILRNPADDRSKNVFDPAIRGKTDRFVYRFRKPK